MLRSAAAVLGPVAMAPDCGVLFSSRVTRCSSMSIFPVKLRALFFRKQWKIKTNQELYQLKLKRGTPAAVGIGRVAALAGVQLLQADGCFTNFRSIPVRKTIPRQWRFPKHRFLSLFKTLSGKGTP